jgi:hypothetical protein
MCLRGVTIAFTQTAGTAQASTGVAIRGGAVSAGAGRLGGTGGEPVEAKFTRVTGTATSSEAAWKAAWADQMVGRKFVAVAFNGIRR